MGKRQNSGKPKFGIEGTESIHKANNYGDITDPDSKQNQDDCGNMKGLLLQKSQVDEQLNKFRAALLEAIQKDKENTVKDDLLLEEKKDSDEVLQNQKSRLKHSVPSPRILPKNGLKRRRQHSPRDSDHQIPGLACLVAQDSSDQKRGRKTKSSLGNKAQAPEKASGNADNSPELPPHPPPPPPLELNLKPEPQLPSADPPDRQPGPLSPKIVLPPPLRSPQPAQAPPAAAESGPELALPPPAIPISPVNGRDDKPGASTPDRKEKAASSVPAGVRVAPRGKGFRLRDSQGFPPGAHASRISMQTDGVGGKTASGDFSPSFTHSSFPLMPVSKASPQNQPPLKLVSGSTPIAITLTHLVLEVLQTGPKSFKELCSLVTSKFEKDIDFYLQHFERDKKSQPNADIATVCSVLEALGVIVDGNSQLVKPANNINPSSSSVQSSAQPSSPSLAPKSLSAHVSEVLSHLKTRMSETPPPRIQGRSPVNMPFSSPSSGLSPRKNDSPLSFSNGPLNVSSPTLQGNSLDKQPVVSTKFQVSLTNVEDDFCRSVGGLQQGGEVNFVPIPSPLDQKQPQAPLCTHPASLSRSLPQRLPSDQGNAGSLGGTIPSWKAQQALDQMTSLPSTRNSTSFNIGPSDAAVGMVSADFAATSSDNILSNQPSTTQSHRPPFRPQVSTTYSAMSSSQQRPGKAFYHQPGATTPTQHQNSSSLTSSLHNSVCPPSYSSVEILAGNSSSVLGINHAIPPLPSKGQTIAQKLTNTREFHSKSPQGANVLTTPFQDQQFVISSHSQNNLQTGLNTPRELQTQVPPSKSFPLQKSTGQTPAIRSPFSQFSQHTNSQAHQLKSQPNQLNGPVGAQSSLLSSSPATPNFSQNHSHLQSQPYLQSSASKVVTSLPFSPPAIPPPPASTQQPYKKLPQSSFSASIGSFSSQSTQLTLPSQLNGAAAIQPQVLSLAEQGEFGLVREKGPAAYEEAISWLHEWSDHALLQPAVFELACEGQFQEIERRFGTSICVMLLYWTWHQSADWSQQFQQHVILSKIANPYSLGWSDEERESYFNRTLKLDPSQDMLCGNLAAKIAESSHAALRRANMLLREEQLLHRLAMRCGINLEDLKMCTSLLSSQIEEDSDSEFFDNSDGSGMAWSGDDMNEEDGLPHAVMVPLPPFEEMTAEQVVRKAGRKDILHRWRRHPSFPEKELFSIPPMFLPSDLMQDVDLQPTSPNSTSANEQEFFGLDFSMDVAPSALPLPTATMSFSLAPNSNSNPIATKKGRGRGRRQTLTVSQRLEMAQNRLDRSLKCNTNQYGICTERVDWKDVASQFQVIEQPREQQKESLLPNEYEQIKIIDLHLAEREIIAPTVQVITSAVSTSEKEEESENTDDETYLQRHEAALSNMRAKMDKIMKNPSGAFRRRLCT